MQPKEFGHRGAHQEPPTHWPPARNQGSWSFPPQPWSKAWSVGLAVFIILAMAVSAFIGLVLQDRLADHLQSVGARTQAQVVGFHKGACAKTCSTFVDYRFTPSSPAGAMPVDGSAKLYNSYNPWTVADKAALIRDGVPIAYDPDAPSKSMLNFEDRIFTIDHRQHLASTIQDTVRLGGIALLAMVVVLLGLFGWRGGDGEVD